MNDELKVGSRVKIEKNGTVYEGVVIPSSIFSEKNMVNIKLDNGYNTGIKIDEKCNIIYLSEPDKTAERDASHNGNIENIHERGNDNGSITIISTGGTIASYVDYVTGAVKPVVDGSGFMSIIPELNDMGKISIKPVLNILSENISFEDWTLLARECYNNIKKDTGVVVLHGTDTMGYTTSLLSFMIQNPSAPLIFVGSQRSIDRPSSDGFFNIISAVNLIKAEVMSEVAVMMHASTSDDGVSIHRGVKIRKMHSSRRDAFRTINGMPLGFIGPSLTDEKFRDFMGEYNFTPKYGIEYNRIQFNKQNIWLRKDVKKGGNTEFFPKINRKVSLVWFYPDMKRDDFEFLKGKEGVVFAGSGLGHMNKDMIELVKELVKKGIVTAISTQCINGTVNMNVYETGRELIKAGAISASIMTPEVAFTKLSWALANSSAIDDTVKLFKQNIAGELSY